MPASRLAVRSSPRLATALPLVVGAVGLAVWAVVVALGSRTPFDDTAMLIAGAAMTAVAMLFPLEVTLDGERLEITIEPALLMLLAAVPAPHAVTAYGAGVLLGLVATSIGRPGEPAAREPRLVLFSFGQLVLAASTAAGLVALLPDVAGLGLRLAVAAVGFLVYFVVNELVVDGTVAATATRPLRRVLYPNLRPLAISAGASFAFGALFAWLILTDPLGVPVGAAVFGLGLVAVSAYTNSEREHDHTLALLTAAAELHDARDVAEAVEVLTRSVESLLRCDEARVEAAAPDDGRPAVELASGGRKLGWLVAGWRHGHRSYDDHDLELLAGLASIGSSALENALLRQRLEHEAMHDALTGVVNRRGALLELERAIERARRRGDLVGLLYVDLDGFKAVNDRLGHQVGDDLLKEVARRLKDSVRGGDLVARLGGDEFAVILTPIKEGADVEQAAQHVLEGFGPAMKALAGTDLAVTPSIGAAVWPDNAPDATHLLQAADAAMYVVKRSGKASFRLAPRSAVSSLRRTSD